MYLKTCASKIYKEGENLSLDFNKNQTFGFTSKLSDFEIVNQEFTRCKCYILATGDNVNGSDITLESVKKAMARGEFYNKPIVAHLYQDPENNNKWRVGGHDSKWVITDTSFEIVNECIPFGTIPESSNLQLEEVLEPDGETVNTYLTCQIILWTGRFNIMDAAYSDDIYFNQSCELSVNEYHWKENDIFAIDDFTFSALCLLNKSDDKQKNVRPCFPSCRVEKIKGFSVNTDIFKQNFGLMLEKLKQYETAGATAAVSNKAVYPQTKGEFKMNFTKIAEILSAEKCGNNKEVCRYRFLNVTDSKVFALDMQDYKPYGFDYAVTTENEAEKIIIDFKSKTEMSLSAAEKITDENFKEFSIQEEINSVKNTIFTDDVPAKVDECTKLLKAEYEKELEELGAAFQSLNGQHEIAVKELEKYKAKESLEKANQHKADVEVLFEKYAPKLSKCAEFLVYKAKTKPEDVTLDEVNEKLTLMVGKYTMDSQKNKNFSYTPAESAVGGKKPISENKYGHLLDKYIK